MPNDSALLRHRFGQIERAIRPLGIEHAFFLRENASLAFHQSGGEGEIDFDLPQGTDLTGTYSLHNHPPFTNLPPVNAKTGQPLSWQFAYRGPSQADLEFACEYRLAQIRIVDEDFVYVINPLGPAKTFTPEMRDQLLSAYVQAHLQTQAWAQRVWDVACENWLDSPDLARLSRTCRLLRSDAPYQALSALVDCLPALDYRIESIPSAPTAPNISEAPSL